MRPLIERQTKSGTVQETIADIQSENYHALVVGEYLLALAETQGRDQWCKDKRREARIHARL